MTKYTIKAIRPFLDAEHDNALIRKGEQIETDSYERLKKIIKLRLGQLIRAEHGKEGNKVIVHQSFVGVTTGGINTANRHIARAFADSNLLFIVDSRDWEQALNLAKYSDVIVDDGKQKYDCDVFIMSNYNVANFILQRVKARKIYTMIHADFVGLREISDSYAKLKWKPDKRCDKVLAVSETAQKGLKSAFDVDSVIVPNILTPLDTDFKTFIVLSRTSKEKGIDRIIKLYDRFVEAGKEFRFFLCCPQFANKELEKKVKVRKQFVLLEPSPDNQHLIKAADYLVQLSYNESYCYSVREALQRRVPVIVSDLPEFNKIVTDGKNGFILNDDFSNLDVEKIFSTKFNFKAYSEKIDPIWEQVMKGEL